MHDQALAVPRPRITRCCNQNCLAIFLQPAKREPYGDFCPACLKDIKDSVKDANDDFENFIDKPTDC